MFCLSSFTIMYNVQLSSETIMVMIRTVMAMGLILTPIKIQLQDPITMAVTTTYDAHGINLAISDYFRKFSTNKFTGNKTVMKLDSTIISTLELELFLKFCKLSSDDTDNNMDLDVHNFIFLIRALDFFVVDEAVYDNMLCYNYRLQGDLELLGYIYFYYQNKEFGPIMKKCVKSIVLKDWNHYYRDLHDLPDILYLTSKGRTIVKLFLKNYKLDTLVEKLIALHEDAPDCHKISTNGVQDLLSSIDFFRENPIHIEEQLVKLSALYPKIVLPKKARVHYEKIQKGISNSHGVSIMRHGPEFCQTVRPDYKKPVTIQVLATDATQKPINIQISMNQHKNNVFVQIVGKHDQNLRATFTVEIESSERTDRTKYEWTFGKRKQLPVSHWMNRSLINITFHQLYFV